MTFRYDYYRDTNTTRCIEDARLAMQAVLGFEKEAPTLETLGLRGKKIHFLGCGPGYYEALFASRLGIGPSLASDVDACSIESAQRLPRLDNLRFEVIDATADLPKGYDVYLERFLLVHQPEETAKKIVKGMASAVHDGGKVILIEYVNSFIETSPPCPDLEALCNIIVEKFRTQNQADPDLGLRLPDYLREAGLSEVFSHDVYLEYSGAHLSQPLMLRGVDYGPIGQILLESYAARYGSLYPEHVAGLEKWLAAAAKNGSAYSIKDRYRLAYGIREAPPIFEDMT